MGAFSRALRSLRSRSGWGLPSVACVRVQVEGLERGAPLQREPAPRARRQSIGVRSEQRSGEAHDMVTGNRRERRAALARRDAATLELAPRPPQLAAQPARETHGREWLAPTVDLAQAAP